MWGGRPPMSRTCEPGVSNYPVDLVLKSEEAKFFLISLFKSVSRIKFKLYILAFLDMTCSVYYLSALNKRLNLNINVKF